VSKPLSLKTVQSINNALRDGKTSMYRIAHNHDVSTSAVQRLSATQKYESKLVKIDVMNKGKDEPYQTEEQALKGLPTYTATNHRLITPIRKDWQLINYES